MSQSLREQLLKAGLATEKQARQAARESARKQYRAGRDESTAAPVSTPTRQAQAEKAARDKALDRERQAKAAAKGRAAELRQYVEQHRVPPVDAEETFSFVDGTRVRRVPVTPAMRAQLIAGTLLIVRCDGRYSLLPSGSAAWIRDREPSAIVERPVETAPVSGEDDPYKAFVVPDDLTW